MLLTHLSEVDLQKKVLENKIYMICKEAGKQAIFRKFFSEEEDRRNIEYGLQLPS